MTTDDIDVEVVFALPEIQKLVAIRIPRGATVVDAIAASGLAAEFPQVPLEDAPVGIWGRIVERDQRLDSGDRVELYRPLRIDPREARRRLAGIGRTMRQVRADGDQSLGSSS